MCQVSVSSLSGCLFPGNTLDQVIDPMLLLNSLLIFASMTLWNRMHPSTHLRNVMCQCLCVYILANFSPLGFIFNKPFTQPCSIYNNNYYFIIIILQGRCATMVYKRIIFFCLRRQTNKTPVLSEDWWDLAICMKF